MDPMVLHDWVEVDFRPLMDAWTRVWACGSPQGVALSNKLLDCCGEVMSVLDLSAPTSMLGKLRQSVAGVQTEELLASYQTKLVALANARRDLAELVRTETGRAAAQLFSET